MSGKRYAPELKDEAVRQVLDRGRIASKSGSGLDGSRMNVAICARRYSETVEGSGSAGEKPCDHAALRTGTRKRSKSLSICQRRLGTALIRRLAQLTAAPSPE